MGSIEHSRGNKPTATESGLSNDKYNQTHQAFIAGIKQDYQAGRDQIKADFLAQPNNRALFKAHTKLVDDLLIKIWRYCAIDRQSALIAVGGYGRGELYPYSDTDLLILLPDQEDGREIRLQNVERMVGMFWDIGLQVGHSVRTIAECEIEASNDITTQTNMIESRLIVGANVLFSQYTEVVANSLTIESFVKAKIDEQSRRYAKYNDTAYNLEPNIKESPGGLRDIHSVIWMVRAYLTSLATQDNAPVSLKVIYKQQDSVLWTWLKKQALISPNELRHLQHHQSILQTIRIYLHYVSDRRKDRLLFDFQSNVASIMGYEPTKLKRASEGLMQRYFRSVKSIQVMNEILLKNLRGLTSNSAPILENIDDDFYAKDRDLHAHDANLFQKRPETIFDVFLLIQRDETKGVSAALLRQLIKAHKVVNSSFIASEQNKQKFIQILTQPKGVAKAMRAMNRYGLLGAYIPAFGKIVGQMQHDLFHDYTVDEHTLNVLSNLHNFCDAERSHEFPLCTNLMEAFDAPHLLYLGALFHDIAKGRGGNHSKLGKVDALNFCEQHGLDEDSTDLVAWMVGAHLNLSATAQKSDLSDPQVIEKFAKFVKTERRLVALYLLTVADVRGTSPKVWNAWKASLFETLFLATRNALKDSQEYGQNVVKLRQEEARARLIGLGLKAQSFERLWAQFGDDYFERYKSDEATWHSRLLTPHLNTEQAIVRSRLSPNDDGIQVMIYERAQSDIFARICNFFDRIGYSIAEAKIYTTQHGYALDTFIVLDQSDKSISYDGLHQHIETELTEKLSDNSPLETPLSGRVSRQVKHIDYPLQISVRKMVDHYHQLEIVTGDIPGLLAKLATLFITHKVEVHNAKINTMGNRAEDSFIISGHNETVLSTEQINVLKQSINECFTR